MIKLIVDWEKDLTFRLIWFFLGGEAVDSTVYNAEKV